jgi:hypothetical protein
MHFIDTSMLADYAAKLARLQQKDGGQMTGEVEKFMGQFLALFECKRKVDLMHEPERLDAGYDELKFHLMKLSLMHDALLSPLEVGQVDSCLPQDLSFSAIINLLN